MASSQATTGCILHPAITINCAFARVAFRELSHETPEERATHFKENFCQYPYQIHTLLNTMVRKILANSRKTLLGLTRHFRPNGTPLLHDYNMSANSQ